jgi:DNA-binding CsgD family transcriptional regulator/pimeloyl-ACP methyl ester carboxylesterase
MVGVVHLSSGRERGEVPIVHDGPVDPHHTNVWFCGVHPWFEHGGRSGEQARQRLYNPSMALPPIGHATTAGGVRIAFHALGEGPAVVMLWAYHASHLELNWQVPLHRGATEFFARYFKVVNLDFRGSGLSERRIASLSLDTFAEDLDAVLRALGLHRVALVAIGPMMVVACHIAARSPDLVSSLLSIEGGESEAIRRVLSLRHVSPQVEAPVWGTLIGGIEDRNAAASLAAVAREALEPHVLQRWENILNGGDLLEIAARVATPTLYVNVEDDEVVPLAAGQTLVDRMPQATLITVPGRSPMDVWRDRAGVQHMTAFLAHHFGVDADLRRSQRRERKAQVVHTTGLSERELEVLRLLAAGRSNQQIADQLFISLNTVSHHLRNIFAKTKTNNRTEAASFAHQQGLVPDGIRARSIE